LEFAIAGSFVCLRTYLDIAPYYILAAEPAKE
jgi:hypothetical protein